MNKLPRVVCLLLASFLLFACSSSDSPPPPPPAPTLAFNISSDIDVGPVGIGLLGVPGGWLRVGVFPSYDYFVFENFELEGTVTQSGHGPDFSLADAVMSVSADLKDLNIYSDFNWAMDSEDPIVWSGSDNPTAGSYEIFEALYSNYLTLSEPVEPFSAQVTMYPSEVVVAVGEDEQSWAWEAFEDYMELDAEEGVRNEDIWASVANGSRDLFVNQLGSIVQNSFDAIDENAQALEEHEEVEIACDPYNFPMPGPTTLTVSGAGEFQSRILITRNNMEGSAYDLVFTCFMSEGAVDTGTLLWGILRLDGYAADGTAGSNDYYRHAIVTWDGIYDEGGSEIPTVAISIPQFRIDEIGPVSPEEDETYFISGTYRVSIGDTPIEER